MTHLYLKAGRRYRAATPSEVCEAASTYLIASAVERRPKLSSPKAARDFLAPQAGLDVEQFGVLFLDKRHRLIGSKIVATGTIDGASVHPREILKHVLQVGAAACICFHNHPSGDPEPSNADEVITQRLKEALALIEVRLVDHLILAVQGIVSLAERGEL